MLYLISGDYKLLSKVRCCSIIKNVTFDKIYKGFVVKLDITICFCENKIVSEVLLMPRHKGFPIVDSIFYPIFVNIFVSNCNFEERELKDLEFILTGSIYDKYDEAKKIEDAFNKVN